MIFSIYQIEDAYGMTWNTDARTCNFMNGWLVTKQDESKKDINKYLDEENQVRTVDEIEQIWNKIEQVYNNQEWSLNILTKLINRSLF